MNKSSLFASKSIMKPIIFLSVAIISCFLWEHVGRFHDAFRPSVALEVATVTCTAAFYRIGSDLAWLSSFLHWVELHELYHTALILWSAVWHLLVTPFETVRGYLEYALTLQYSYVVILGTLVLAGVPLVYFY